MSLYAQLRQLLCTGDIDSVQQALELILASVAEVDSSNEDKQLETLAQTLVVESSSSNPQKHWRGLLHFELNRIDELECEDSVFRLDALIEAGLRFEHAWCKARGLNRTVPKFLSPAELYGKCKSKFYTVVGSAKTHKKYPLALQTRVKLQRHYVNLYKSRDRTREVQHTLPYKAAVEIYGIGVWGADFEEVYEVCLEASGGQGYQVLANAWKDWETSKHPVHFLDLATQIQSLTRPVDYATQYRISSEFMEYHEDAETLFEPKLLEFLQYELPKSSWKFFSRVNDWCNGKVHFKINDPEYVNFDLLHWLCQMDFPLSGKYMEQLADMPVRSRGVQLYLSMSFGVVHYAEKVFKALQLDDSSLNSFDTSHWTETLVKVVSENSPRNLRSKDLVQIFEYFKSGWSNEKISWGGAQSEILTPRQLALVEKWITESGCEKLKALSELYSRDLPSEEAPF